MISKARGIICSIVSAVGLGTLAIFVKTGLAMGMHPLQIIQYRFTFGAIMLFAWFGLTRPQLLKIRPRGLVKAAVLGMGIYPFQSWFFIKSLQYIPAATTSLIYYLYPLVTTLIAMVFLGLRPSRIVLQSLLLILAGCGLVFYHAFAQAIDMRGVWYALACMITFSIYLTAVQLFTQNEEAKRLSLWVVLCMAIVSSCLSSPLTILDQPFKGWVIAMGLGLLPSAMAISLLYRAVESIGSAYTAMFSTIEPVTTVLLAALILGEPTNGIQITGMILIIAGIIAPNIGLIRKKHRVDPPGGEGHSSGIH